MDNVLLGAPAAYDEVVDPGKAAWQPLMALSMCHWKDDPAFLRPKGILLYSNRLKGVVMAVFCMSSGLTGIWWYTLPQVNLGEDCATSHLGGEFQHVGQRIDIRLCHQVGLVEISAGTPAAICLLHHVNRAPEHDISNQLSLEPYSSELQSHLRGSRAKLGYDILLRNQLVTIYQVPEPVDYDISGSRASWVTIYRVSQK